jgi:hypothetical protein
MLDTEAECSCSQVSSPTGTGRPRKGAGWWKPPPVPAPVSACGCQYLFSTLTLFCDLYDVSYYYSDNNLIVLIYWGANDWIQGFKNASQVLCHWAIAPALSLKINQISQGAVVACTCGASGGRSRGITWVQEFKTSLDNTVIFYFKIN